MTLERHRSKLIPDVSYSLDGTVFVTDTGGTFPLRKGGANKRDIRSHTYVEPEPAPSFRSYDPRRDDKRRRYKQRNSPNRYSTEVQNIGYSTISTNTSSLVRRLRRTRSSRRYSSVRGQEYRYSRQDRDMDNIKFKDNGYGSLSAGSEGRRLKAGPPRMTPEFADTLRKKKAARSLDRQDWRKESPYDRKRRESAENGTLRRDDKKRFSNGSLKVATIEDKRRLRKIHEERLPYVPFLVCGACLLVLGITRVVVSSWHEYLAALWAGLFAIFFGIIGAQHKGLYLAKGISGVYVLFGLLSAGLMLAASGLVLPVLVPTITFLADDQTPEYVIDHVVFTRMNQSFVGLSLAPVTMVYVSLAVDLATVVFIFVGLFALTAAMMALSNHWDASYLTTADCDHRGNPRLFNPIEQTALGEATVFLALVYVSAEAGYSDVQHDHFFLSVVAGSLVTLSGILSFCFGKRTDVLALGTLACFFELLSFLACCGATVLTVLGLVRDVTEIQRAGDAERSDLRYKELLGLAVIAGALCFVFAVNLIFIVGTVFRQFRQVCCRNCCGESDHVDVGTNHSGTLPGRLDYNSMSRSR